MEAKRSLDVRNVERDITDSVGRRATHHPIKTHRKEDGKATEKETAKEPRKVESSKEEKAETKGKEKERSTKSQNHQKNSGQVDLGNSGQSNVGMLKQTLRVGGTMIDWYTADSNSQTSAAAEEFQHASVGDLRLSNLGHVKHIESFQHDRLNPSQRTITFGIDTVACKTVVPANHLARGYLVHKDSLLGCAYSTAGRDEVYDQGKRILCTLDGRGKPMAIESRKVNCRRPLMAVTEMTDCGRWVCFGPQRQGFSFDPRTGQTIEFTPTLGGWDLTMKLEPPERANKTLKEAIQEISTKKRGSCRSQRPRSDY